MKAVKVSPTVKELPTVKVLLIVKVLPTDKRYRFSAIFIADCVTGLI